MSEEPKTAWCERCQAVAPLQPGRHAYGWHEDASGVFCPGSGLHPIDDAPVLPPPPLRTPRQPPRGKKP